ncbi:Cobalt-zinc-cadmium resistance protein CzcB [Pseudobythopirellula maris]|uniref:Cobalt-zinc-cadmium resistance protein CzcB n=1 Tax=Pseudobythopirellula maris TaxID=2527991 RepID=A0A5C5ZRS9_9BACT|nr:efflux RND transporter periplasmic adaptor subunit [Pseudobythopirellula maris]TWT89795.1 Cobalt-zinc-cadmium resistance protein CzcB [Pseudobythopirellula maris]
MSDATLPQPQPPAPAAASPLRWLLSIAPTVAAVVAIGLVGYWGHSTDWRMPSFDELVGASVEAETPWCEEHNVPAAECVECQASLLPNAETYGWCDEHGLEPCPLCHPEVVQIESPPVIATQELERVAAVLDLRERAENVVGCPLNAQRVQFASVEAVDKAGIDVDLVQRRALVEAVEANGEITYDQTHLARLASRAAGSLWRVEKSLGDRVSPGDVLALVDAAAVGRAKAELLDALADVDYQQQTVDRLRPLAEEQIIPGARMLESETALQQAEIKLRQAQQSLVNLGLAPPVEELARLSPAQRAERLRLLGLSDELKATLDPESTTSNLLPIVSPIEGEVIRRDAVAGEVVGAQAPLFQVADTREMWLVLSVPTEESAYLMRGQEVRFQAEGLRTPIVGRLDWISTDIDPHTRTVSARAVLENPRGELRSETFGKGRVLLRDDPEAIVVPESAVQWDGSCYVVFVRDRDYFKPDGPKVFHTRPIRRGVSQGGFTEAIAGVWPGEVVVTEGSGVLRSQILKNNLGAGCTCGH